MNGSGGHAGRCATCRAPLEPYARFCGACGEPAHQPPTETGERRGGSALPRSAKQRKVATRRGVWAVGVVGIFIASALLVAVALGVDNGGGSTAVPPPPEQGPAGTTVGDSRTLGAVRKFM